MSASLLPWIAVAVTVVAGWALVKRFQTHLVLLFAGLAILICVALMVTRLLSRRASALRLLVFDIFAMFKNIMTKQSAGTGFLIMTAALAATWTASAPRRRWSTSP